MKKNFAILIFVFLQLCLTEGLKGWAQGKEIFQIGKKDQSFTEFARAPNSHSPVVYLVGQSSPSKDWSAYQPGSFDDFSKNPRGVPFQVKFSLHAEPKGKFVLRLDAIFRQQRPAAPRYAIDINGHTGSYQLNPEPAPKLWWSTGGDNIAQFVGYESMEMPLPASYLRHGGNTLTVRCIDGFGIYYDDLSLINEPEAKVAAIAAASVQPTIFYKSSGPGLAELAKITLRTSRPIGNTSVRLVVGSTETKKEVSQESFGDIETTVEVPATDAALPVVLYVGQMRQPIYRGIFRPQRRWRVYAEPREQADFGYDEVPAVTLEWEDQYTDRFLDILHTYPNYSFTLDASANLQSYLKTRDEMHKTRLLDYLRNGKVGVNALWTNFFTGLATPEELFQTEEYALRAGKQYRFNVDEASQTDEPTVTWALPQILAESGIKYFANGSDPIHGPFNPIGHLNFQSPYYWEAPNGSKVLVWDAVAYMVVRDLTWGGWNPEDARTDTYDPTPNIGCWVVCEEARAKKYSPSLFGLQHSLPLFLSQYDRGDYPYDAVFLYGLENDEIPISHFGSADIIQRWNEEYQYPKVIPGTQRDYFRYITDHFGSQIRTYRGDGGAYWEDEAGADARVAALNRNSQMQVAAAEKLGSIATWFQPHLRYDDAPFRKAWDDIMLADVYVWSGEGSSRSSSYLTRVSEDVHRGWAEDAFRQTRDLLTVSMDQIGQSIKTGERGVIVFNVDSQRRSGLLDWDLGVDETPEDPATGQPLPCALLDSSEGYWKVRCWVSNVPALGYNFYPVIKGKVLPGKTEAIVASTSAIEGRYYKLQLDPSSGAVAQLIDKETGQDLVSLSSGYGLNEYLYVTGGDFVGEFTTLSPLYTADPTLDQPKLTVNRQTLIDTPQVTNLPWGTQVTIHAKAVNTPQIITTITLNDEKKEVTFQNEVEKVSTLRKEGVYFAFPFAIEKPHVQIQGATAWVDPETEMLPGAGRQSFVTQGGVRLKGVNQSIGWVSVDAPLVTLEDINRGMWPDSTVVRTGSIFSYAMNNYWPIDTPAQQGGHFTFRYALTSGTDVPLAVMAHLTTEGRNPLYGIRHSHKNWEQNLPYEGASFVGVSPDGVSLLTIRPTSDSRTYLIRVQNTTDQPITAALQFPLVQLEEAYLGSVLGDKLDSTEWSGHEVKFAMNRYDIKTVVVRLQNGSAQPKNVDESNISQ
jgi:alpha-mannosidase